MEYDIYEIDGEEYEIDASITGQALTDTINKLRGAAVSTEQAQPNELDFSLEDIGIKTPPKGFNVSSPEALESEIETKIKPYTSDWFENQAKIGFTQSSALLKTVVDTAYIDPLSNIVSNVYSIAEGKETSAPKPFADSFIQNLGNNIKIAQEISGADFSQARSDDLTANMIGTAIQVATDPIAYIPFVGTAIKTATTPFMLAPKLAGQASINAFVGGMAELGGEVGDQIEREATGKSTGTGRVLGSITSAIKGTLLTSTVGNTVKKGGKWAYDKYKNVKGSSKDLEQAQAVGAAKALLKNAAEEEGVENLDEILKNFNSISNKINKTNAPLIVALAENPSIRKQVERLAKTNPDFRSKVNQELNQIAINIDANADKIFGARYTELPKGDLINIKNVRDRLNVIDSRIEKLSDPFEAAASKEGTGNLITSLIAKKAEAVRADISPRYNFLVEAASAENVVLPSSGTKLIHDFVAGNALRDIFGKGTKLDSLIMKHFAPSEGSYPTVSFSNVDSLKRAINELQRKPLSATEKRLVNELEDKVNDARGLIPGKWNEQLKALDREYYERLGVPFNAQGIKDIDAKKYAEQVAPIITKNGSALKQFLNVTGDEGVDVARNAMLSDAYFKVIKDGAVDIKALDKYIKNNVEVIDNIPGLKASLTDARIDGAALKLNKFNLEQIAKQKQKELSDNFLSKLEGTAPNYTEVVSRTLKDRSYYNKLTKDLKATSPEVSKAVLNNLRRELIETARSSPQGAYKFLVDPKNSFGINQLMGKGYQQKVKDLALLSDAVKKADVSKLVDSIVLRRLDPLAQAVPGLDAPYLTSNLRDRISSPFQKVFRIASRIFTERTGMATDKQMAELLLDPDGINKLSKIAQGLKPTFESPIKAKELVDAFTDLLPHRIYLGTAPSRAEIDSQTGQGSSSIVDIPEETASNLGNFY